MQKLLRSIYFFAALIIAIVYFLGYGASRWKKFIVMQEYLDKDQRVTVRNTGPGFDVRENFRGGFKNRVKTVAFFCFRPLCFVEDLVRGDNSMLPPSINSPRRTP